MIRITLAFWIGLVCALGYGVFQVKYEVQEMEARLAQLNRGIISDRQAIHVLRAEWSYLNQPTRLDQLTKRHLPLAPIAASQIGRIEDVPFRAAAAPPPATRRWPATPPLPRCRRAVPSWAPPTRRRPGAEGRPMRRDGPPPVTDLAACRPQTRGSAFGGSTPGGPLHAAVEKGQSRLVFLAAMFSLAFLVIAGRLVDVTLMAGPSEAPRAQAQPRPVETERADIVDRNGTLLATSLPTPSLYANPKVVPDAADAARRLAPILTGTTEAELRTKLQEDRSFVWLKRQLTPRQQHDVIRLGIPGLEFQRDERRIYPQGRLVAHVVGFSGIDHTGLQGVEKTLDNRIRGNREPIELSLDLRVQHVLREELQRTVTEFKAIGAAGLVMDAHTGEVVALVSLPDYDANSPGTANEQTLFNRVTLGVYEMGSVFKVLTAAMALDTGKITLSSGYDASRPIQISRFSISDYKGKNRWLSVPEIIKYSSNIGAAKMAMDVGINQQRAFFEKLGFLKAPQLELPELGFPLVPNPWREINAMTIAFGHGISVTPLHVVAAEAAMVNGGVLRKPTLLKYPYGTHPDGSRVIKAKTSDEIRRLMRLVVTDGSGKKANVPGYLIGGKTGSAEKAAGNGYRRKALLSSFVGAFPMNDPQYVILVMIDEPQGQIQSQGYATGGWVAAPLFGRIVERIAPLVGVAPIDEDSPQIRRDMVVQASAPARSPNAR
ncbi:cell division protein FtsL [Allostella humosa]|nr:penicillin-binding transpeptidase domain-containing protein [Stella humosa]